MDKQSKMLSEETDNVETGLSQGSRPSTSEAMPVIDSSSDDNPDVGKKQSKYPFKLLTPGLVQETKTPSTIDKLNKRKLISASRSSSAEVLQVKHPDAIDKKDLIRTPRSSSLGVLEANYDLLNSHTYKGEGPKIEHYSEKEPLNGTTTPASRLLSVEYSASSSESVITDDDDHDEDHEVSFLITIAFAHSKPSNYERSKSGERKKMEVVVAWLQACKYLHWEYIIAPDEPLTAADAVNYNVAAKVYPDDEAKIVETWEEGDNLWIAWQQRHVITLTSQNLMLLYKHTIHVKIWDSRDTMSAKARLDKPRAYKLSGGPDLLFPVNQVRRWLELVPGPKLADLTEETSEGTELEKKKGKAKNANEQKKAGSRFPKVYKGKRRKSDTRKLKLAKDMHKAYLSEKAEKERKEKSMLSSGTNKLSRRQSRRESRRKDSRSSSRMDARKGSRRGSKAGSSLESSSTSSRQLMSKQETKTGVSTIHEPTLSPNQACVSLDLANLFTGVKSITSRLDKPEGTIRDAVVNLTLEGELLSDELKYIFNPLSITIKSAKALPENPVSYERLSQKCRPVYCKYTFLDDSSHVTPSKTHAKNVYYDDTYIIFLGRLNEGEVREHIQANALRIELHDRDVDEDKTVSQELFGNEKLDHKFSTIGVVSGKYDPTRPRKGVSNTFGIATVPLSDLLRGITFWNIQVPVNPCPIPDFSDELQKGRDMPVIKDSMSRPDRPPIPPGRYIEAGTVIKLRITLSHPFVPKVNAPRMLPTRKQMCQFSRVIYYFSYKMKKLLRLLEEFVMKTNAKTLGIRGFAEDIRNACLSTVKLSAHQRYDDNLDVITGFFLNDGKFNLVVLEGPRKGAMRKLPKEVEKLAEEDYDATTKLYYDTSTSFSNRLYISMDVCICRIRLYQSLQEIMAQPLLYVRNMVPRACLDCLMKIQQIIQVSTLREVILYGLFPTSEMVVSLSKEFGIPLTYEDFEIPREIEQDETRLLDEKASHSDGVRSDPISAPRWLPTVHTNPEFESVLKRRQQGCGERNHLVSNIISMQEAGKHRRPRAPTVRSLTASTCAHNYGTQALNTNILAHDIMKEVLTEADPRARYSHQSNRLGATLFPVDLETHKREEKERCKKTWMSSDGFICPGVKSSKECNEHIYKPGATRVEELKTKFKDNVETLHTQSNFRTMKHFDWDDRKKDMILYPQPPGYFGSANPKGLFICDDIRLQHELDLKRAEKEVWESRVVVDDPVMRFHRSSHATELTNASNQLDKMRGLLKDAPMKMALKRFPVPPLCIPDSVLVEGEVIGKSRPGSGKFFRSKRWLSEKNGDATLGISASMDNKFQEKDVEHVRFVDMHNCVEETSHSGRIHKARIYVNTMS